MNKIGLFSHFRCHNNFYEMQFRSNILDNIKKMAELIEKADVELVQNEIAANKCFKIKIVAETSYQIGSQRYPIDKEIRAY